MNIKEAFQNPFIKKWVGHNLSGWFLGLVIGPFLFTFIIIPFLFLKFDYNLINNLMPLFFSFPFGLGLGFVQQIGLRNWSIQSSLWMLVTALGIGIPATLMSWLLNSGGLGYGIWSFLATVFEVILIGFCIGGLQVILIRRQISNPIYWVLVYVFGFITLGAVLMGLYIGAFWVAEPIEKFFYSLGFWELVYYRDALLLISIGLTLPFFAAFFYWSAYRYNFTKI